MSKPVFTPEEIFDAFKKAYDDVPSQDNEGYVPDRGGFKTGFYSGVRWTEAKLESLLGPEVFGIELMEGGTSWYSNRDRHPPTHTARLFNIQKIEPVECVEHIPKLKSTQPVGLPTCKDTYGAALILGCSIVCAKCGKELRVAKWEPL